GTCPEGALLGSEMQQVAMRAVATLPRQQAMAFTLRIVDEQEYDQIANLLHCSPATVRTHVARARQRLSDLLKQFDPNGVPGDEQNH
ncbi:MAG: RNA polymerase sigma factor, partial [Pirellulaceae bacterium]